jgi:phospholipid/cholesterol/gamma-HCH transport system substrate-binding protein
MSAPTNRWKLGLFVVLGSILGVAAVLVFGARSLRRETVTYRSYFDEAVSGLDIGSSVSFRGVRVGDVGAIEVAPDRRHVEVIYKLETSVLIRLGLAEQQAGNLVVRVPSDLRVQLSSTSITGGKYLKLDFFDPRKNPPPELPFEPGEHTIPATASTLKNLEDSLLKAIDQMPDLVDDLKLILAQTHAILLDVGQKGLPARAAALIDRTDHVMLTLEGAIRDVHTKEISLKTRETLANLDDTLGEMRTLLARAGQDGGVVESVQRASDAIGDLARGAEPAGGELEATLHDLRQMADSVRRLTDALERDSDMLVKGRAKESSP